MPAGTTRGAGDGAGRRRSRGDDTHDEIVNAAVELFAQHGYRGTTVKMVADRIGITDAGVLYHFATKSALLWAAVSRYGEVDRERFERLTAGGGVTALRGLAEWGGALLERPDLLRLEVVLRTEALAEDAELHDHFVARSRELRDEIVGFLQDGIRGGEIRSDVDALQEATALMAFADGVRLQWFYDLAGAPIDEMLRTYVTQMLDRITVPRRRRR